MEAPAELLAALPALATALALLLAWLLVRRGPAASPDPAGASPGPAPPAEASGTPAPPDTGAPEPAAAPQGPGERAGPAEAEEQAAQARQVMARAPGAPPAPVRFPPRGPCRPGPVPTPAAAPRAGGPPGGQSPRPAGKEGRASRRTALAPRSDAEGPAERSCGLLFRWLRSASPSPQPGFPSARRSVAPGTRTAHPTRPAHGLPNPRAHGFHQGRRWQLSCL